MRGIVKFEAEAGMFGNGMKGTVNYIDGVYEDSSFIKTKSVCVTISEEQEKRLAELIEDIMKANEQARKE